MCNSSGRDPEGLLAHTVTSLSNMVWFWKYWICFLTGIIEIDCKVSTFRWFQKYWIRKALFHKRYLGSSIQYFKKEVLLDICLKKCFYEPRNTYPLFEKSRKIGWYAYMRMPDFTENYPISALFWNRGYFSSVHKNDKLYWKYPRFRNQPVNG